MEDEFISNMDDERVEELEFEDRAADRAAARRRKAYENADPYGLGEDWR